MADPAWQIVGPPTLPESALMALAELLVDYAERDGAKESKEQYENDHTTT